MLTGATLIASFGDEDTALLLYNTHTLPVPSVLSAKYFVVDNGKITAIKGTVRQERLRGSSRRVGARLASNGASIEVDACELADLGHALPYPHATAR
jgi:hypothetical protein